MNYTHHGLRKHMVKSIRVTRRRNNTKLPNPQITETRIKDEMARDIRHTYRFVASINILAPELFF